MKVYVAHDGKLRVRIGYESLGSESLGPWYGGTGAIQLRQVLDTWFWAYTLDDHGYRGTAILPEPEFVRVREHIPSACVVEARGRNLDIRISEADLRMLEGKIVPLTTRVARFGDGIVALFGDFEVQHLARTKLGLFHLGGDRFNGFRIGPRYTTLGEADMPGIVAHLPSARLLREGPRAIVEMEDADLAKLLAMAEEA
jgi:hypothetical protein